MENFVLYEELGRGDHSIIYKGRRKGTIHFVAIHCIEKCKRPEVTNTVRMTHDISNQNVVKFYEWYETSNHLWLVVELCTGGSLETLIQQDKHLPESSVRVFGIDLITGLHYIHSLGILFCDLQPSKVLLDGSGILKFSDFGLARVEGEDLEELFHKFADPGEMWATEEDVESARKIKASGSPTYMAPESLDHGEMSILCDLWALGCVLYELFTGHPPFLAETFQQLREKIINKDFPLPKVKGTRLSGKASPDFLNLLEGLLSKDPEKRLGWPGLVTHPFWEGKLAHLAKDLATSHELRSSITSTVQSSGVFVDGTGSALGRIKAVDLRRSIDRPVSNLDMLDSSRPASAIGDHLRPKTAPGTDGGACLFTLSARPHTAVPPDDRVTSPQKQGQSPLSTREALGSTHRDEPDGHKNLTLELIYHHSDFQITPIVDNPKIQKPVVAKYDAKILPVPPFSADKILSLPEREQARHMKAILDNLAIVEKGPPSQKRFHLLHYMAAIAVNPDIATTLVNSSALNVIAKQVKEIQHLDVKIKMGRVLGLLACYTVELQENINISEVVTVLTEVIRENGKNTKLKQGLLPAIGEILYMVAVQEQTRGSSVENWNIPSMAYTIVSRHCREGEDSTVNHIAAKIVENITVTKGVHAQKFVTSEVGQSLWYSFKHSTVDALRITALSALCRITRQNTQVFQSVIDTVGLSTVLSALSFGITRIQQSVITMVGALIASGTHLNRMLQDKDFLQKIIRLLESTGTVIRAKAFVVLREVVRNNPEMLLHSCQLRLVMYIERDLRRQTPRDTKGNNPEVFDYLADCLELILNSVVSAVPSIFKDILSALETVAGRKHPNTVQARQLKSTLPLIHIFLHLVTSQVFRPQIVNEQFIKDLATLLSHVKSIELGETNIESASGSITVNDFVNTVMSVMEGISQHPTLLMDHCDVIMKQILPTLAELVTSQNGDTRALSLRLFSEIATVFLSHEQYLAASELKPDMKQLHGIISTNLLPQFEQILLDQDPLPSYGLKLLLAIMDQNPVFIKQCEQIGLISVIFQVLLDHQNNPLSSAMQSIAGIINCLVAHKETNMRDLYDQGLIDYFTTLFFEVSAACFEIEEHAAESKTATSMLQTLLDALHNILKYVSEVVRKALQAKRTGGEAGSKDAEDAEHLLLMNKSLTDVTSLLTQLFCHEDVDIQDLSIKCLSLLVQLFGGDSRESMSPENMDYYAKALSKADAKKQKVLLRIVKRLVSTEKFHCESMREHGGKLAEVVRNLVQTASSHADVALSSLAAEILKLTGHMR